MIISLGIVLICLVALVSVWLPLNWSRLMVLAILLVFAVGVSVGAQEGSLSLLQQFYGGVGDLSAASVIIALLVLLERPVLAGLNTVGHEHRAQFYGCIMLSGLALYPLTLGLSSYDPYSLGFSPLLLVVVMMFFVLAAFFLKNVLISIWLLMASIGYLAVVYASVNFWDYLIDPWIWLYSFFGVYRYGFSLPRKKAQHQLRAS